MMIIILFMIITVAVVLFLFSLEWYYCLAIMIFLIFQILVLNYESKIIIERKNTEQRPDKLYDTLGRTFSKCFYFVGFV